MKLERFRPCDNCKKEFKVHRKVSLDYCESNWWVCPNKMVQIYIPMNNLEFLEYKYEQKNR
jgi:hypothetical protein